MRCGQSCLRRVSNGDGSDALVYIRYEGVSESFRTELINMLTFDITRRCFIQRVMAAKLTRLSHKIAIQLHLLAENCTICSSRSRRPVLKLLDTPSYCIFGFCHQRVSWLIRLFTVSTSVQRNKLRFCHSCIINEVISQYRTKTEGTVSD
jgi:hypothetical protein